MQSIVMVPTNPYRATQPHPATPASLKGPRVPQFGRISGSPQNLEKYPAKANP